MKTLIEYRLYYFMMNLAAFILTLIAIPFRMIVIVFCSARVLLVTDGSEMLSFPWEWEWRS